MSLFGLWTLGFGLASLLASCAPTQPDLTPVPARHGAFVVDVETEGMVQALDSHAIALPGGVWGSIEALREEGEPVKKGEVIATISVRDLEEDLMQRRVALARERSQLKRAKADAPVKTWEIEREILDEERDWRAAELKHQSALRGGRRDELAAARRDLALAELTIGDGLLERTEGLYEKGIVSRSDRDKAALDRKLAELERRRARLALAMLEPGAQVEEVDKARLAAGKARAAYDGIRIEAPSKAAVLELAADKNEVRIRRFAKRVRQLEERVAAATIRAPEDGLVLYPLIWNWMRPHVGMRVWEGLTFLEVATLDRVKILGAVSEAEIAKVKAGAEVAIAADGYPGRVFPARVHRVSQLAKEADGQGAVAGVKRFDIEVRPAGPTPELKPNMRVRLTIVFQALEGVSAVPADAIFDGHVWLATPKGPEKKPVTPRIANEDWVALKEPLPADAKVYLLDPTTFGQEKPEEDAP